MGQAQVHRKTAQVYHQTGEKAAIAILGSQRMKRGSGGLVGGGIYFAAAPPQTRGKAHSYGVMLKCTVLLGNFKSVDATKYRTTRVPWPTWTHTSLKNDGFDSVMITGLDTGVEFVVYNCHQVEVIEWHSQTNGKDIRNRISGMHGATKQVRFFLCVMGSASVFDNKFQISVLYSFFPLFLTRKLMLMLI